MRMTRVLQLVALGSYLLLPAGLMAKPPDSWITAKAKIAVMTDEQIPDANISVDTNDGTVTLHGKVTSAEAKTRAEEVVRAVDGVSNVNNKLQVTEKKKEKETKVSDADVKSRLQKSLEQDAALKDSSIKVESVNQGTVVLTGTAKTVQDHLRAVSHARKIPGVKHVTSQVRVEDEQAAAKPAPGMETPKEKARGAGGDVAEELRDSRITADTKIRLMANDLTPARDINVDTNEGVVTLFGMVPSQKAKETASAEARKIRGVKKVNNELEVVPAEKKEAVEERDEDLQDKVEQALKSANMEGTDIDVQISNGVARLTGTVQDDDQRVAAARTAHSVPGIRSVREELRMEPSAAQKSGGMKETQMRRPEDKDIRGTGGDVGKEMEEGAGKAKEQIKKGVERTKKEVKEQTEEMQKPPK